MVVIPYRPVTDISFMAPHHSHGNLGQKVLIPCLESPGDEIAAQSCFLARNEPRRSDIAEDTCSKRLARCPGSHDLFFTRTVRQSVEKCPHNEIDGSPGGAPQARNASEDTETRGDGLMKSGGRILAGSNHAPVEMRRPLSAQPQLVRAKELGPENGSFWTRHFFYRAP